MFNGIDISVNQKINLRDVVKEHGISLETLLSERRSFFNEYKKYPINLLKKSYRRRINNIYRNAEKYKPIIKIVEKEYVPTFTEPENVMCDNLISLAFNREFNIEFTRDYSFCHLKYLDRRSCWTNGNFGAPILIRENGGYFVLVNAGILGNCRFVIMPGNRHVYGDSVVVSNFSSDYVISKSLASLLLARMFNYSSITHVRYPENNICASGGNGRVLYSGYVFVLHNLSNLHNIQNRCKVWDVDVSDYRAVSVLVNPDDPDCFDTKRVLARDLKK